MDDKCADFQPVVEKSAREDATRLLTCFFLALVVVAAWLRLVQCNESLWIDELHTAWTVDGGLSQILPRAELGNYSPLYFLLPWLSTRVFGMHEWSLRLPSLLAGIALAPACFFVACQWFRSRAIAFLAAVLVTLDPHLLFYSLDARPYAIVQLGGVLHVWLLGRLLQEERSVRERAAYCLLGIALVYLHYTSALLLVAEFAFFLIWLVIRGDRHTFRETLRSWRELKWLRYPSAELRLEAAATNNRESFFSQFLGCFAVMAIGCLPALLAVRAIAARRGLWSQFVPRHNDLLEIFPFSIYLGTAAVALAAIATWRVLRRKTPILAHGTSNERYVGQSYGAVMLLLACWLFVPLLIAWQTTRIDLARVFFRRYLMFSYCAMILLTSGLGAFCPSRGTRLAFTLLVAGVTGYSLGPWRQLQQDGRAVLHSHENWREAVAAVNRRAVSKDSGDAPPIFVRAGLIEESLLSSPVDVETYRDYLLLPVSSLYKIKRSPDLVYPLTAHPDIKLPKTLLEHVQTAGGCWLVVRGRKWVDQHGEELVKTIHDDLRIEQSNFFGNVAVIHCRMTNE